ncbi:MAG TPA: sigma-70 family RNA polymerase sigma factor [Geminicoccus sp.]|jgi:RNA polymerase sigma-70 factor (ECF subfamily)|uniref:sigma-70 family RNA polymerase sigma factor n=1 Tax=Geminicoccus sp. TaxID=2024832 RepID=UPI002E31D59B|nr:sigma-70 family RNA polymerase sigma factor [Geminicoccus sp.]HEX2528055.1 sigma-70 family RNA polymerase sigma factor [Geminicoccus sp.]
MNHPLEPDFAELIERVAGSHDKAAFAALFHHFAPKIRSYLRRLGVGDTMADDLTQEVMLSVWRRAGQYDRRLAAPATWVYTIARNKRIDALRRDRGAETSLDDTIEQEPDDAPLSDEIAIARQMREKVLVAVDALPPDQARLLKVFYFEEKSHSVIAEEMELPLGTVKSRLRLALAKMRTLMNMND